VFFSLRGVTFNYEQEDEPLQLSSFLWGSSVRRLLFLSFFPSLLNMEPDSSLFSLVAQRDGGVRLAGIYAFFSPLLSFFSYFERFFPLSHFQE